MTSGRRAKSFGLAVVLAVATTLGAHAQLPVPATGASQLLSAAQISQLAAAQSETSPAASRRIAPVSAPRITSRPAGPAPSADIGGVLQIPGIGGGSVPWNVVVMLTALTLIPSILVCMTPFARLLIVFHFLRQALGLQTTPSNQTLIGLSLILTFFLMQPVANQIYQQAFIPLEANQITAIDALTRAEDPMRNFMAHYVRDKDVSLFVDLAHEPHPASINDVSMRVLLPAYILSELKAGFQIGTVLFLPFLIVDMVVASITTSVGMLQLPPVVISTPLKLLLFLMVDGWHLLVGSLMRSFQ
jgi:flagellar biosynthetic protein FliP